MEIRYNVTKEGRKEMVGVISQAVGIRQVYLGMPTCAYAISNIRVTKDGTLEYDDRTDSKTMDMVIGALAKAGFTAEEQETESEPQTAQEGDSEPKEPKTEDTAEGEPQTAQEGDSEPQEGITIEVPIDKVNTENLERLLEAKGGLIMKALGIGSVDIKVTERGVAFPWFDEATPEQITTYTKFISAICKMTREQKRVTAKAKENENERYAFRCFLLRLGFIGAEYKTDRKLLLSRLEGSTAFKTPEKKGGEQ